ncbi:acetoin:2,6-dichlorophenolindophenol oxidoreductase subunit alpha [Streptococcus pneumoniae]|nr:acetoin:2,6-dichlorophenolindophenol oxidoreductase subunit alpha [Streptococcus pneumoniae]
MWKQKDPIENLRNYLIENNIASAEELEEIQAQVKEAVEASVKFAEESPFPSLESAFEDIYAD